MMGRKRQSVKPKKLVRRPAKKVATKAGAAAVLEEFYPIVEGRAYVYRYESPEWPQKSTATMRVKGVSQAGGKTTATWEETNPDPPGPSTPSVRSWKVERSGKGVLEGDKDWSYWVIRTPLRKGMFWKRDDGTTFTIVSLAERIEVPAGVYENCLQVTYDNEDLGTGELYYAKGVGLVRSIQRGEWVPYDYWLESVRQEPPGAAPAATAGGQRMMAAKGKAGR